MGKKIRREECKNRYSINCTEKEGLKDRYPILGQLQFPDRSNRRGEKGDERQKRTLKPKRGVYRHSDIYILIILLINTSDQPTARERTDISYISNQVFRSAQQRGKETLNEGGGELLLWLR